MTVNTIMRTPGQSVFYFKPSYYSNSIISIKSFDKIPFRPDIDIIDICIDRSKRRHHIESQIDKTLNIHSLAYIIVIKSKLIAPSF